MKNNGRNVSSAIMGRERCGKQMELVLTTRTPPDQLASLDLSTSTKLQIHKHTNTRTQIQKHKFSSPDQLTSVHLYAWISPERSRKGRKSKSTGSRKVEHMHNKVLNTLKATTVPL